MKSGLGSADSSGWVQALGTIFAIAGSLHIANNQYRENLESAIYSQKIAKDAKIKSILAVVGVAKHHATNINNTIPEEIPIKIYSVYDQSIINNVIEALSAAPLYEIDSPEAITALLSLKHQFLILGRQTEEYIAGPWMHKDIGPMLETLKGPEHNSRRHQTLMQCQKRLANNVKRRVEYIYKDIDTIETQLKSG